MSYPSIKTINTLCKRYSLPRGTATKIRRIMESDEPRPRYGDDWSKVSRMGRIDLLLGTFGVEYIPEGHNSKSPAIEYCNTGDTYAPTVMMIHGRFQVGCWGDIVERGSYD